MIKKIITEKRFYFYALASLFLPVIVSFALIYFKEKNLEDKAYQIQEIERKAKANYLLRSSIRDFLCEHQKEDEEYIENFLESYCFLQEEIQSLQPLLDHPAFQNSLSHNRYKELCNENHLRFSEDQPKTNKICKETLLHQKTRVEVDKTDLTTNLHLIEGKQDFKPQLIIHNFTLEKTKNNTALISIDLLKRTFKK